MLEVVLVDELLDLRELPDRVVGYLGGELHRLIKQLVVGIDVVDESGVQRLVGWNQVAPEHVLQGASQTDQVWSVVCGGELGGQPNSYEPEGQPGALGRYTHVAGQRTGQSLADCDAVYGGDDRLGCLDHLVPGVFRLGDDIVGALAVAPRLEASDVGACAEAYAGAGPHDGSDRVVSVPLGYLLTDLVVHLRVHGVEPVGPVHGDEADAALHLGQDRFVGHLGTPRAECAGSWSQNRPESNST